MLDNHNEPEFDLIEHAIHSSTLSFAERVEARREVADLRAERDGYRNGNRDLHSENQVLRAERDRLASLADEQDRCIGENLAELRRLDAEVERMRKWMERAISDGGIDHHFVDAYRATSEQEAADEA